MKKPARSDPYDKTRSARSAARNARAVAIMAPITLDALHAKKLQSILDRTGETRAEWVRRMIREQA